MKCHLSVRSSPGSLQGVGCGLPDTALPAERHLVLRADVPVGSLSPPGLSLLLPEHCPGPPHHHTALQPRQEGQALFVCVCVIMSCTYKCLCVNMYDLTHFSCLKILRAGPEGLWPMPAPLAVLCNFLFQLSGLGEGFCTAVQQPLHQQPESESHCKQTGTLQNTEPLSLSVSESALTLCDLSAPESHQEDVERHSAQTD